MEVRALALMLTFLAALGGISSFDLQNIDSLDSHLLLVNRENRLPYDYMPDDLVLPDVKAAPRKEDAIYMSAVAAAALEDLFADAEKAGYTLYAVSGYRSYALQKAIYDRKVEQVGEKKAQLTVAPPGRSEHQLGLAMDVNGETTVSLGLVQQFGETPEGIWVAENAHRHGFIIRYQKDQTGITGYAWEPWHLRYVGISAAEQIYLLGVPFEEYHALLQQLHDIVELTAQDTEENQDEGQLDEPLSQPIDEPLDEAPDGDGHLSLLRQRRTIGGRASQDAGKRGKE